MNVQNLLNHVAGGIYSTKIIDFMDNIDYRRVTLPEDLKAIEDLRRSAYLKANIYSDVSRPMVDVSDTDPNVFVFGTYYEDQLVATVRIHILKGENRNSNSRIYFPNILDPLLDQGLSFMDPTRFAIDPLIEGEIPGLPLITLRLGFMAAKHFNCDYCLSMIKEGHGAFYRRVFQSSQIAPFIKFPAFTSKYALFSSPKIMEELIFQRYPVFRSLGTERKMLFDAPKPGQPQHISVKPTSRIAIQKQNPVPIGLAVY